MLSKIFNTILLLALSVAVFAQNNYNDRWKETQRTDRKKTPVAFKDTMQITNITKDSLKIRRGAFLYPGTINNDLLDMGYEQYQIIKLSANELIIDDQDYIHIFSKEAVNASSAIISKSMEEMATPLKPVTSIDTALLKGTWQPYSKKKKDGSAGNIDYKTLIRSINFTGHNAQNKYGTVFAASESSIESLQGSFILLKDDANKASKLTVYKISKDELILEDENGIIYYMKQF